MFVQHPCNAKDMLQKDLIYVFQEIKLRGLVSNFVSDLYISRIGLPIWLQQNRQNEPGNI
jgi:hypothetical protein